MFKNFEFWTIHHKPDLKRLNIAEVISILSFANTIWMQSFAGDIFYLDVLLKSGLRNVFQ